MDEEIKNVTSSGNLDGRNLTRNSKQNGQSLEFIIMPCAINIRHKKGRKDYNFEALVNGRPSEILTLDFLLGLS